MTRAEVEARLGALLTEARNNSDALMLRDPGRFGLQAEMEAGREHMRNLPAAGSADEAEWLSTAAQLVERLKSHVDSTSAELRRMRRGSRIIRYVTAAFGLLLMVILLKCHFWVIRAETHITTLTQLRDQMERVEFSEVVLGYDICNRNGGVSDTDAIRLQEVMRRFNANAQLYHVTQTGVYQLLNPETVWTKLGGNIRQWAMAVVDPTAPKIYDLSGMERLDSPQMPMPEPVSQTGSFAGPMKLLGLTMPGPAPTVQGNRNEWIRSVVASACAQQGAGLLDATGPQGPPVANFLDHDRVWRASVDIMLKGNDLYPARELVTGYASASLMLIQRELASGIEERMRWWLPILNGALGAILFCLVAWLNTPLEAPDFGQTVLRIFFGAFAGFLVSSLFVPSGLVTTGPSPGNSSWISLLAFVFGYSATSFISLLEWINRRVVDTVRANGDGGKGTPPPAN